MKKNMKFSLPMTASLMVSLMAGGVARGQSSDTLIDKLVQKGILTVKEADELRQESDKDFTKAYALKNGLPDWVSSMKFSGDFRGRFEQNSTDSKASVIATTGGAANSGPSDRNRYRYRARFGITATFFDDFEVGLRLASANPAAGGGNYGGNPVSANTDLSDGNSRKFVYFDAAYGKWTPIHTEKWTVSGTIGKMDSPFQLSNMVFDYDYQPEGAALQAAWQINDKHALKFNGAFIVLDEFNQPNASNPGAGRDPFIVGGQLLLESKWTPKIETAIGVSMFNIANRENLSYRPGVAGTFPTSATTLAAPNVNDGNTRDNQGNLVNNYDPIVASAAFTYKLASFPFYKGEFPIKLAGEYMYNPGATKPVSLAADPGVATGLGKQNTGYWAGLTLGKSGHKGTWELNYKYQYLGADAWYEELVDDDFGAFYNAATFGSAFSPVAAGTPRTSTGAGYRGGTNVKGHVVKATYSFTDAVSFTFTYYLTELINANPSGYAPVAGASSASSHFMADLMWKF